MLSGTLKRTELTDSVLLRSGNSSGSGWPCLVCGMWAGLVPTAARTFSILQPLWVRMSSRRLDVELDTVTAPAGTPCLVTRGTVRGVPTDGEESSHPTATDIRIAARIAGYFIPPPPIS